MRGKITLVALAVGAVILAGCTAASARSSAGSGSPQNPCHGTQEDCTGFGPDGTWYVTEVNVNGRQISCLTQEGRRNGQLTMSCDWSAK